ncbi:protein phosphatase 2C domain-containing protein [Klebsiella pneumoniae]
MGSSHRQNQLPCQDAFCYRNLGDRLVAVVCDGAGSAAYSEQGAAMVAHDLAIDWRRSPLHRMKSSWWRWSGACVRLFCYRRRHRIFPRAISPVPFWPRGWARLPL